MTLTASDRRRTPARPAPRQVANMTVVLIAVVAGLLGSCTGATLTGWPVLDAIYRGGYAAVVTLLAASARRWTWIVLGAVSAAIALLAHSGEVWAIAALAVALASGVAQRRHRRIGAVVGALSAQALLRIDVLGPTGLPALVAMLAPLPCAVSAWRLLPTSSRQHTRRWLSWAALGLLLVTAGGIAALTMAVPQARRGEDRVRAAIAALNRGEAEDAQRQFELARAAFADGNDAATNPIGTVSRVIPLVGPHLDAITEVSGIGEELAGTAARSAAESDYGALGITDGRIDLDRFTELLGPLHDVEQQLQQAERQLDSLDTDALVGPAVGAVDRFSDAVDELLPTTRDAITAAELAPGMLGRDDPRRWLVLFSSPAEARGLGGFFGYYAEITATDGDLEITDSGRVPSLNDPDGVEGRRLDAPEDYVRRYGRLQPQNFVQDVAFSPDFPSVAGVFESVYEQATGRAVDGTVVIDPYALAELLRITGPITVDDVKLTPDNAADFLLRQQYADYDDRAERGDVLDTVARETFDRLISGRLDDPARMLRIMAPMAAQRRVMVHSTHPDEQALFRDVGLDGSFPSFEPELDLLAVTNQNAGNNKLDAYLRREVRYEPRIDPERGTVTGTVTVTLFNDADADALPMYVKRNRADVGQPPGVNWTWLSIHTPLMLASVTVDGSAASVEPQREFGWNVYALDVGVPAGGSTVVTFDLDGGLDLTHGYHVRYQPQPLVNADQLTVTPTVTPGWAAPDPADVTTTVDEPVERWWELRPE